MIFLYVCFFISISIFVYSLLALSSRKSDKYTQVEERIDVYIEQQYTSLEEAATTEEKKESFIKRTIAAILKKMKWNYYKNMKKEDTSKLELQLLQAGRPFGFGPVEYKLFRFILMIALPGVFLGLGFLAGIDLARTLFLGGAGLFVSIIFPKYYIASKINYRGQQTLKELPDTLDLLTISLEAGMGFDGAVKQVVSKKKGVLTDEFSIMLEEMRLGKSRKDALVGMSKRNPSEDLKTLIYSIVQSEKLGIGMVEVLRVQTEDIRERTRQRAEEKALKAPVKMMIPLILFIFPSMFIILLGPAVIQIMNVF